MCCAREQPHISEPAGPHRRFGDIRPAYGETPFSKKSSFCLRRNFPLWVFKSELLHRKTPAPAKTTADIQNGVFRQGGYILILDLIPSLSMSLYR